MVGQQYFICISGDLKTWVGYVQYIKVSNMYFDLE